MEVRKVLYHLYNLVRIQAVGFILGGGKRPSACGQHKFL